ncbi:hypothetical protein [Fictibacillus sp. S7]|uniref:hypothetical protein n=1 Tax=Fictibacillus sp. S7 TaxID=2212476 RepID=UPI0010107608|nr:hypothetical protein [Fictibacillus sp. S7]RXY98548.1 hypothetical protein DMO16_02070 [Fictibacillus sp. S7]
MAFVFEGKDLERLVDMKFAELEEAFEEKLGDDWEDYVDDMKMDEHTYDDGDHYYIIAIFDLSCSMTTIRCNKYGYNVHWGSSTPVYIKTIIENVMSGE